MQFNRCGKALIRTTYPDNDCQKSDKEKCNQKNYTDVIHQHLEKTKRKNDKHEKEKPSPTHIPNLHFYITAAIPPVRRMVSGE